MSNYINQNLINIPASGVPSGTLAFKLGNNIFTAGNNNITISDQIEAYQVVDDNGVLKAQKLAFNGTQVSVIGQPQLIQNLKTFNTLSGVSQ